MPVLAQFKRFLDQTACRADREPAMVTTRDFLAGDRVRMATARRQPDGRYAVSVYEARKGGLLQHFKKTATLRDDAGLVRAVILLDEWAAAQRDSGARENKTPVFGGGALVDHVAAAKGWRHYLKRAGAEVKPAR